MAKKSDGLYEQIDAQCNTSQIQDLLRRFKPTNKVTKKEIQITGTKPAVLKQLRESVSKGYIPLIEAENLLRDCEENGQQHIFYYQPKRSVVASCRSFDSVYGSIFGDDSDETFPLYEYPDEGYHWVDARQGVPGKPRDWVLKVYGQDLQNEQQDRYEEDGLIHVILKPVPVKAICLVRWNDPDLLEVRIDSAGLTSVSKREQRLQAVWNMLAPTLGEDKFVPWDLTGARTYMAARHKKHPDFELDRVCILDKKGGSYDVACKTPQDSIEDLRSRSAAVLRVMKDSGKGRSLSLHWKILSTKKLDTGETETEVEKISCACGGKYSNEIILPARVTPKVVDHVTTKLRQFNG